ncbi:MAG: hypothetical protein M3O20_14280 [Acidobacteriota bacterium]|nr:hypothetical protein [Acidobacteriota bacterium]
MRRVAIFVVEGILLGFAINLTSLLLSRDQTITLGKWCWFALSVHGTYLTLLSDRGKRMAVRLRSRFGGHVMISYVFVAAACVGLGLLYWTGINAAYARLFKGPAANATAQSNMPREVDTRSVDSLYLSLKKLPPQASIMFLKEPIESGQAFYRFQVMNNGSDLSDLTIAVDLPALLARQPVLIDRTGADTLSLKAAFSAYVRTEPGKVPQRIADLNNTAILDISRFKNSDLIDVGFVTAPIKDRQVVMITAPRWINPGDNLPTLWTLRIYIG